MKKLPAWHRDAPKPEAPKTGNRPAWAKEEQPPGPDFIMPDGRTFDFKTTPAKKAKMKPKRGLGKGLAELTEENKKVPRIFRCIEDPSAGLLRNLSRDRAKRAAEAETKFCPNCGKGHNRSGAKYCSAVCREAFWQKVSPGQLNAVKLIAKGKAMAGSRAKGWKA